MRNTTCRRVLAVVAIGASGLSLSAPRALAASSSPPESGLQCANVEVNACWAHQVVFRGDPMLEFLKWAEGKWPNGYNYKSNGCSVERVREIIRDTPIPDQLLAVVDDFAAFFKKACRIHDFGYRNFGSGSQAGFTQYPVKDKFLTANQLSWNEPTAKLTIDHRFGDLMRTLCDAGGSPDLPGDNHFWCDQAAAAFESAVRKHGSID